MIIDTLILGFLLASAAGLIAWKAGALSSSGALAACLTGTLIFGLGGLPWAVLLLTFFISSSLLSRTFAGRKAALNEKFSKGSRRDWGQVFANGGLGVLLAVAYIFLGEHSGLWFAFVGAMAAVNADTWSTEVGVLSTAPPRLITTGRIVERGTSGGITWLGTFASLSGAVLIGLVAWLLRPEGTFVQVVGAAAVAGLAGSLFDSLLGATVQAVYRCPVCGKETERHPYHTCGTGTVHVRGWSRLGNDEVNFLCSLAGAGSALLLWLLL